MKQNTMIWLLAIVMVVVLLGSQSGGVKFDIGEFDIGNFFGGGGGTGLVDVYRHIDLSLSDKYAGSALATKTLVIYDANRVQKESLTTGADGTIESAHDYGSGEVLYIYYESSNDKVWFQVTVPQMTETDAHAGNIATIPLQAFSIGTYTTDQFIHAGAPIADAGNYNFTTSGETPTFTYILTNTGNDQTGLMTSYDPIYGHNFDIVMYVTFSGTDYEKVLVYGFENDYTLGTTHYVARRCNADALTKWKVGNEYRSGYEGTQTISFSLDGTGYTASGATTMQIYVYAYSDAGWSSQKGGNFGVEAVQLAEHTITLQE